MLPFVLCVGVGVSKCELYSDYQCKGRPTLLSLFYLHVLGYLISLNIIHILNFMVIVVGLLIVCIDLTSKLILYITDSHLVLYE